MTPIEWVNKVLARHNITKPDGRPLYQYRLTDQEFRELTALLKLSSNFGLRNAARMLMWDAAMVFYAAEWWRRHYVGHWGWDGIFDSLGFLADDISTGRRGQIVEVGLRKWHREVRSLDGRRQFLGTVATEGGLPLNQLAESGGWLGNVLQSVVKKHLARGLAIDVLVEGYQDVIPSSYQSPEIKKILEDMAVTVVELRQTHQLHDKSDPLAWLDQQEPRWRERFPLPVDNDVAVSLLTELISVAAKQAADRTGDSLFELERLLINTDFEPVLQARVELPAFVPLRALGNVEQDKLVGRMELEVLASDGQRWPFCRAVRTVKGEEPCLKLFGGAFVVKGPAALLELRLRLLSFGEVLLELPLISADVVDEDAPCLFSNTGERWLLQGGASQSTRDEVALVYVPSGFELEPESELTEVLPGKSFLQGKLYQLRGEFYCAREQERYRFKTSAEDSRYIYQLTGRRLDLQSVPSIVFLGTPDVWRRDSATGSSSKLPTSTVLAKPIGLVARWRPLDEVGVGHHEVRLMDAEGNICFRTRIGVLHADFDYRLAPDNANSGVLHVTCGADCEYAAVAESSEAAVSVVSRGAEIRLVAEHLPPPSVRVSLLPITHQSPIELKLPFPARGAVLFGPDNLPIKRRNARLCLHNLYGFRIKLVVDSMRRGNHKACLRFILVDKAIDADGARDLYLEKEITVRGQSTELAPIDWQRQIQGLLSVSASLDARVQISLFYNGSEQISFFVHRYEHVLKPDRQEGSLTLGRWDSQSADHGAVGRVHLKAIFLEEPDQEPFDLPLAEDELTGESAWSFQAQDKTPGAWLVYPAPSSSIRFRPLLWRVGEDESECLTAYIETIHTLQKAMRIGDPTIRQEALGLVLHQMASDLDHDSWHYLEGLTRLCGHLPLATFDVWRCAVKEPRFLATLLIKKGYEDIVERLEEELPVIWELISLEDWRLALDGYRSKLYKRLSNEEGTVSSGDGEVISELIGKCIDRIKELGPSMASVSEILKDQVLGEPSKELQVFACPVELFVKPTIQQTYQELLQRQDGGEAETQWPPLLRRSIAERYESLPASIKELVIEQDERRRPVVHLPLVLAWDLGFTEGSGWLDESAVIFKIDQLKSFDESWFSTVFQYITGWLSQQSFASQIRESAINEYP